MNYGIPYMGSKAGIVKKFINIFPNAENFYDVFGGGFSVTHAMVKHRSKDFKHFHFNEIRPGICELIQDAINGKYSYDNFKPDFIDRETFYKQKESNPYIKMIWSFGNNGNNYLFGKDIEQYKKSIHQAVVFGEFDETAKKTLGINKWGNSLETIYKRRIFVRNKVKKMHTSNQFHTLKQLQQLQQLHQLQQLQQLQRLERLEQLQRLEQIQKLTFYNKSYEEINIKPNSIIYCDPPYLGTASYDNDFDFKKFYSWLQKQNEPTFVSEYNLNINGFVPIWAVQKRSVLSANNNNKKVEKIYCNKSALEALKNNVKIS